MEETKENEKISDTYTISGGQEEVNAEEVQGLDSENENREGKGKKEKKPDLNYSDYLSAVGIGLIFIVTILVGLFISPIFVQKGMRAFKNADAVSIPLFYIAFIIIFSLFILYIAKKRKKKIVKWIFLFSVFMVIIYVIAPVLDAAVYDYDESWTLQYSDKSFLDFQRLDMEDDKFILYIDKEGIFHIELNGKDLYFQDINPYVEKAAISTKVLEPENNRKNDGHTIAVMIFGRNQNDGESISFLSMSSLNGVWDVNNINTTVGKDICFDLDIGPLTSIPTVYSITYTSEKNNTVDINLISWGLSISDNNMINLNNMLKSDIQLDSIIVPDPIQSAEYKSDILKDCIFLDSLKEGDFLTGFEMNGSLHLYELTGQNDNLSGNGASVSGPELSSRYVGKIEISEIMGSDRTHTIDKSYRRVFYNSRKYVGLNVNIDNLVSGQQIDENDIFTSRDMVKFSSRNIQHINIERSLDSENERALYVLADGLLYIFEKNNWSKYRGRTENKIIGSIGSTASDLDGDGYVELEIYGADGLKILEIEPHKEHLWVWIVGACVSIALVGLLIVYPEWYVVDTIAMFMGVGAMAMIGISLSILPILVLLTLLAIYDAISVYKTKHMISLADNVMEMRLPVLLVIPKSREYSFRRQEGLKKQLDKKKKRGAMFMGLGDIIIPGLLVISTYTFLPSGSIGGLDKALIVALSTLLGSLIGYTVLMRFVLKGNPQAGLPLLNGGAILGYVTSVLILFGDLGISNFTFF